MSAPAKLLVAPHLEFGDAIISNAICRALAAKHPSIVWLARIHYIADVRRMFADLPNVQVLGAWDYDDARHRWLRAWPDALRLGFFGANFNETQWDREFYRQAGLSFDLRWDGFRLPPDLFPEPASQKSVALVHEDAARKFTIIPQLLPKGLDPVFITRRPSIWDWMPEILTAKELHFIDSSFLNLADSLYALGFLQKTRLVWHKYARPYARGKAGPPTMRAPWIVMA